MYLPASFQEQRIETLHALIRERPLGALVALTTEGIEANHIPFEIDPAPGPFGTLRAHIARANALHRTARAEVDALVLFSGPQGYISPSWYAAKRETGAVVPTWNYIVVHARGTLRFVEDRERLRTHVARMTARHEAPRPEPWSITDAPPDYLEKMLKGIVGIEIEVRALTGKWKLGQNRNARDRASLLEGLCREGAAATELAEAVRRTLTDSG
jgi:transcriptional regulator